MEALLEVSDTPAMRWRRWRGARTIPRATCLRPRARPSRRKLQAMPHADRLLAVLEGEEEDDRTLGRIFGEELPSGLVLVKDEAESSEGGQAK